MKYEYEFVYVNTNMNRIMNTSIELWRYEVRGMGYEVWGMR